MTSTLYYFYLRQTQCGGPVLAVTKTAAAYYPVNASTLTPAGSAIFIANGSVVTMDRSWTVNVLCPLPSTTSLALSPPASTLYGQQVRLTATVSPASATGQVSFYDGAFFLGNNSLSGGTASIQSVTLRPGPHSIRTRYPGDGIGFSPSLSSASALSVSTVRSDTFVSSPSNPVNTGTTPVSVTPGDFNGDGKTDLAVANAFSNNRTLYKGDGAGAFHPARRGDNRGLHADCFGSR